MNGKERLIQYCMEHKADLEISELYKEGKVLYRVHFIVDGRTNYQNTVLRYPASPKLVEDIYLAILQRIDDWDNYGSKGLKSPRQAQTEAWMENVINDKADANGEYVPSTKQILDKLATND